MQGKRHQEKRLAEGRVLYRARGSSAKPRAKAGTLPDWKWVQANRRKLERDYAGRWIAVSGRRIVGTGAKLSTAVRQARKAGVEHPFVTAFRATRYQDAARVPHWL